MNYVYQVYDSWQGRILYTFPNRDLAKEFIKKATKQLGKNEDCESRFEIYRYKISYTTRSKRVDI